MSRNSRVLYIGFLLIIVMGLLHLSAELFYLYWVYWWFDWSVHFLAGFSGGLVTYWVLADSGLWRVSRKPDWVYTTLVFVCVMIVGVGWEIFEYTNNLTDSYERLYSIDVASDLIFDAVGALLTVPISRLLKSF